MKKLGMFIAVLFLAVNTGFSATIFSDSFDGNTSLSGWTLSSTYASYYTGSYKNGTAALRVRSSATATAVVDTTGYENIVLSFNLAAYSLESGEYVYVEYNTGSSWVTAASVADGSDTGGYSAKTVSLPASADDNSSLQVRIRCAGNTTYDYGYLDDFVVTGDVQSATTTTTVSGAAPSSTGEWVSVSADYGSPNYPSDYPNSQDDTTTITKSGATKIRVVFDAFYTESGYDYVYILDGSGSQVASYNGNLGSFTSVEVDGDTLKVRFTSDGSVVKSGFHIDTVEYYTAGSTATTTTTVASGGSGELVTIFTDGFESGSFGSDWSTSGTEDWRVQVTTSGTEHGGSYHVLLDDSTSGGYSTSQLILDKDLSGYDNITVEYYIKDSGDEDHSQDGFYVYSDGSWTQVVSHEGISSTYTLKTVDLSAYDNITMIMWQQYDNYPYSSDGHFIDDVTVTGYASSGSSSSGAVVSSHTGMGSIVYTGGVAFRVWAPFATSVAVAGSFNSWSDSANPLVSEGNGYWSVDVDGASDGDLYKFVINGDSWKKDPYARQQEHSAGASIVYETGDDVPSTIGLPYFEDQIIYQLHVGSYVGSSSTGISDFYDVAEKAEYIAGLGCNMVELLPIMEFPGDNSWGYNPTDIFSPEADYGGADGLKYMIQAFHDQGVGVILDIVYNHLGPSDLDLWQFDGWSENDGGGIYFYNDWKAETDWGHTRPDYGRNEVRSYLKDNAVYWLTEFNADGLRWDSTINIRKVNYSSDIADGWSLMQYINNEIDATKPAAISIAEDLQQNAWLTYTTGEGGAGFDAQWDAGFVHPVKEAIETEWDSSRDMSSVASALSVRYGDRSRQVIYVSSHDEVGNGKSRPPSAIDYENPGSWYAKKRSTLGTAVLMTAPGIPMIFQGEEFLQPGYFDMDVANNYLSWDYVTYHSGIVQMYTDLINMRKNYSAFTSGNINVFHVDDSNKLIAYHVWDGYQNCVVIANFGSTTWDWDYEIGWPVWATGHSIFNSDYNGYDSGFGNHGGWDTYPSSGSMDGMSQKASIAIAPYSVVVYDLY